MAGPGAADDDGDGRHASARRDSGGGLGAGAALGARLGIGPDVAAQAEADKLAALGPVTVRQIVHLSGGWHDGARAAVEQRRHCAAPDRRRRAGQGCARQCYCHRQCAADLLGSTCGHHSGGRRRLFGSAAACDQGGGRSDDQPVLPRCARPTHRPPRRPRDDLCGARQPDRRYDADRPADDRRMVEPRRCRSQRWWHDGDDRRDRRFDYRWPRRA